MNKLILLICCVFINTHTFSYDYTDFSNTLGWENKWNKIIVRSTEKYLSRLENGPFSKLSTDNKELAVSEMRESLNKKLSWEVMGQDFSQGIIKHCDPDILNTMTRFYKKEKVLNIEKKRVVKEYSLCAKKGYMESIKKLKKVMITSLPETKKIIKKYQ